MNWSKWKTRLESSWYRPLRCITESVKALQILWTHTFYSLKTTNIMFQCTCLDLSKSPNLNITNSSKIRSKSWNPSRWAAQGKRCSTISPVIIEMSIGREKVRCLSKLIEWKPTNFKSSKGLSRLHRSLNLTKTPSSLYSLAILLVVKKWFSRMEEISISNKCINILTIERKRERSYSKDWMTFRNSYRLHLCTIQMQSNSTKSIVAYWTSCRSFQR